MIDEVQMTKLKWQTKSKGQIAGGGETRPYSRPNGAKRNDKRRRAQNDTEGGLS
jgi:hypothetical protein